MRQPKLKGHGVVVTFACDRPACLAVVRLDAANGYAAGWVVIEQRIDDSQHERAAHSVTLYVSWQDRARAMAEARERDRKEEEMSANRALHFCPSCAAVVRDALEAAGFVGRLAGAVLDPAKTDR